MKKYRSFLSALLFSLSAAYAMSATAGEWRNIHSMGVGEAEARASYQSMVSGSVQYTGPICRADGMFPWLWYCSGSAYFN